METMTKEDYLKRWETNPEEFFELNEQELFNEEFIWELLMIIGIEQESKAYKFLQKEKSKLAEALATKYNGEY